MTETARPSHSILIVNPNISLGITDILVEEARRIAGGDVEIRGITAPFGSASLESQAELAIAAHAVLEAIAANADWDAAIIGAFGDPGLAAAQEISPMPVFGLARSGLHAAGAHGRRFAIVTLGELMRPSILRAAHDAGLGEALVGLHVLQASVLDLAGDRAGFLSVMAETANRCIADEGAEAILFGGAPFAGIGRELATRVNAPVLDGLTCAVQDAVAAVSSRLTRSIASEGAVIDKRMHGVSPALAALIQHALRPR